MKVTGIDLSAQNGIVINLSFRDPSSSYPYIARDITGLDAPELTQKFYGTSATKQRYYDTVLKAKDIAIAIALNPQFDTGKSYSDLRDDLYRVIGASRTGIVTLTFKNGSTIVALISGFVTKFETTHFTDTPEVKLTITCSDPMLRAPSQVSVVPQLYTSESIISDAVSTAPHGFYLTALCNFATPDFKISSVNGEWQFWIHRPIEPFLINDKVYFSSDFRNKYVYVMRDGVQTMLADSIMPNSMWPIIFPGDNHFAKDATNYFTWNSVSYYHTYWGV